MSESFLAQLPSICETCTLGWANDDVAQQYLRHILQRVNIILPRRKWHIGTFKEFYPRGQKLLGLNVNQGSEVCIRFRDPASKTSFLPFHEVLCTTMHELAHCKIRRHDRTFWSLYYDLVRECEALEAVLIDRGVQLYPEHVRTIYKFNTIGNMNCNHGNDNSNYTPNLNDVRQMPHLKSSNNNNNKINYKQSNTCVNINKQHDNGNVVGTKRSKRSTIKAFSGHGQKLGGNSPSLLVIMSNNSLTQMEIRRLLTLKAVETRERAVTRENNNLTEDDNTNKQKAECSVLDAFHEDDDNDDQGEMPDVANESTNFDVNVSNCWACPRCTFVNLSSDVVCAMCTNEIEDNGNENDVAYNNSTTLPELNHRDNDHNNQYYYNTITSSCINDETFTRCKSEQNKVAITDCTTASLGNKHSFYEVIDCDALSEDDEINL